MSQHYLSEPQLAALDNDNPKGKKVSRVEARTRDDVELIGLAVRHLASNGQQNLKSEQSNRALDDGHGDADARRTPAGARRHEARG